MIGVPVTGVRGRRRVVARERRAATSAGASRPACRSCRSAATAACSGTSRAAVRALLDARDPRTSRRSRRRAIRRAAARISSSSTPQRAAYSATGTARKRGEHRLGPVRVLGEERVVDEPLLHDRAEQRREAPGVGAGAHPQVEVGHLGGLGARPGRSRSARARGPWRSRAASTRARGKLCDCHGFLPMNTATSACSKSPRVWPPYSCESTNHSPIFSCASALER